MGMTIDEFDEYAKSHNILTMTKEFYENRLKADMVAMLDELDLELYEQYEDTDLVKVKYIRQSIQQKINALTSN